MPDIKNIAPDIKNRPHDPQRNYTVPWMAGTVGIVVNTDKIKESNAGFKDVFQDKYKGRVVALADSREFFSWAMCSLGLDANQVSPENNARPSHRGRERQPRARGPRPAAKRARWDPSAPGVAEHGLLPAARTSHPRLRRQPERFT